jgi:limonene-1,2-epoxide hydrolase
MFTANGLGALMTLGFARLALAQGTVTGRIVAAEEEKANVAVVNEFCATFVRRDLQKAVSLLADNATYRPTQRTAPVVGKEKVTETLEGFFTRFPEFDFKVLNTVALGPIILNERDDIFGPSNTQPARTFHAYGVFLVENGKIVEWQDFVLQ